MEDGHLIVDGFNEADCGLFCIFDGHGGKQAMEYCVKNFENELKKQIEANPENMETVFMNTYKEIDNQFEQMSAKEYGTTCTSLLIRKENGKKVLYSANVGDSRAVLVGREQPLRLTYDHKGTDEDEWNRIDNSGGFILLNRVGGILALTRALGDFSIKNVGLICDPFYKREELTEQDKYIVIASDGLWDIIQDEELPSQIQSGDTAEQIVQKLHKIALEKESTDNLTIMVLQL